MTNLKNVAVQLEDCFEDLEQFQPWNYANSFESFS